MNIGPVELLIPLVVFLVLYGVIWQEVASVRRQVDHQTRAIEAQTRVMVRMGQAAGWLPPDPPQR